MPNSFAGWTISGAVAKVDESFAGAVVPFVMVEIR